ncbi:hypothetical protein QE152_g35625 [Popillia japonica]|uniref:Uncharacterized protein n=1 Tax=Popillia japonica TaxID=7064 RepID=A0AAW1IFX5_POPJA
MKLASAPSEIYIEQYVAMFAEISGNDYEHEQADADDNEADEVEENDETGSLDVVDDSEEEIELTMEFNINSLIKEVRRVVRIFRKSPLKNAALQKYVKEKHNKELQLTLDCRTCWNSLIDMLKRFILLKDCTQKTLIDLAILNKLSEADFEILTGIVNCLEPVRLAVLALCRSDANLYTADIAFNFMFEQLKQINSSLSIRLFASLRARVNERRTTASQVMCYITNPKDYLAMSKRCFSPADADPKTISTFIRKLVKRLSLSADLTEVEVEESEEEIPLAQLRQDKVDFTSLKEKLNQALENAKMMSAIAVIPSHSMH